MFSAFFISPELAHRLFFGGTWDGVHVYSCIYFHQYISLTDMASYLSDQVAIFRNGQFSETVIKRDVQRVIGEGQAPHEFEVGYFPVDFDFSLAHEVLTAQFSLECALNAFGVRFDDLDFGCARDVEDLFTRPPFLGVSFDDLAEEDRRTVIYQIVDASCSVRNETNINASEKGLKEVVDAIARIATAVATSSGYGERTQLSREVPTSKGFTFA